MPLSTRVACRATTRSSGVWVSLATAAATLAGSFAGLAGLGATGASATGATTVSAASLAVCLVAMVVSFAKMLMGALERAMGVLALPVIGCAMIVLLVSTVSIFHFTN